MLNNLFSLLHLRRPRNPPLPIPSPLVTISLLGIYSSHPCNTSVRSSVVSALDAAVSHIIDSTDLVVDCEYNLIDLCDYNLNNCTSCASTGSCSSHDDISTLCDMLIQSDGIVLGTSVSSGSISLIMSRFLDRLRHLQCNDTLLADKPCGLIVVPPPDDLSPAHPVVSAISSTILRHGGLVVSHNPPSGVGIRVARVASLIKLGAISLKDHPFPPYRLKQ